MIDCMQFNLLLELNLAALDKEEIVKPALENILTLSETT